MTLRHRLGACTRSFKGGMLPVYGGAPGCPFICFVRVDPLDLSPINQQQGVRCSHGIQAAASIWIVGNAIVKVHGKWVGKV